MIKKRFAAPSRQTPAARPIRRVAVALPLVAILGYIVFWFSVAGTAENQALAWVEAHRAKGFIVAHKGIQSGGFPLEITLTISEPVVARPGGSRPDDRGWSWSGPEVVLSGVPWSMARFNWRAEGLHKFVQPTGRRTDLDAGGLEGWGEYEAGQLKRWEAWLTNGKLAVDGRPVLDVRGLLVQHLPDDPSDTDGPHADKPEDTSNLKPKRPLTIDAKGVSVAKDTGGPLGDQIDRLSLDLSLNGPIAPGAWPQPALEWRDAGGVLEVKSLGLSYGPLNLTGDGTLAIDPMGQPMGAFATRITGFGATIDALKQQKMIDAGAATTAQVVLGLLATGPVGGPKRLDVPVTLQDRTVSVGSIKMFRLKPVPWFH